MGFLSGAMLWGLLAAGIPILIHLTGRARPVPHRFAAMRFLERSQRASSRALRLKHLLLLLLRMAALALLAFALARPLWPWPRAAAQAGGEIDGDFVIVLDASLSMRYREQDGERFERARAQASRFLERLAPQSRVALIRAGAEPERLQGRLTLNHETIRAQLKDLQAGATGLNLGRALEAARAILEHDAGDRPRAVLFFTDLQRNSYSGLVRAGPVEGTSRKAWPPLLLVDVGSEGARNGAVLSLRLPGPSVPADQTLTLAARIQPLDPNRVCPVDLHLDGMKIGQQPVEPRGAGVVDVQFSFPAGSPGPHYGDLQLAQSDALMLDQKRYLAYVSGRPPKVLVVEQPDEPPGRGSAFFLRAALASPAASSVLGLTVNVENAGELHAGKLAQHQSLILADCGLLSESVWQALAAFVEEGGGLFVWLGPRTAPDLVRRQGFSDFARHHGLLPGKIGAVQKREKAPGIRVTQPDHPILARFPPGVLSELRGVSVRSFTQVALDAKDPAAGVILELADGSPLLLEKPYGRGQVLLCAIGPEEKDSDLPKHGEVFVTWMLEACRALTGRGEEAAAKIGHPLRLTLADPPADGFVSWQPPDEPAPRKLALEPESGEGPGPARARKFVTPRLDAVGLYRVAWKPKDASTPRVLLIAVNPDESESDLSRVTPEAAAKALSPWKVTVTREFEDAPAFAAQSGRTRELPVPLLLGVLALLLAESFLSNRMYRTTDGEKEPGETTQAPTVPPSS
jgi:hypothetical protein